MFVARADAICQRLNTEIAKVKAKSTSLSEIERLAPGHAALELSAATELATLSPPAVLAGQWRQLVAYRRTLAQELQLLATVAKAKDLARVKALAVSKLSVHKKLFAVGNQAGFKYCSQVG